MVALYTRTLPRALKDCNVSKKKRLMGSVGLRMPDHLVSLDQSMNRLVGPVDLTELPRNGLMAFLDGNDELTVERIE